MMIATAIMELKMRKKSEPITMYMVFVEGRGEPRKIHPSYKSAYEEAERLAIKEPNCLVRILLISKQIKGEVKPVDVPIEAALP